MMCIPFWLTHCGVLGTFTCVVMWCITWIWIIMGNGVVTLDATMWGEYVIEVIVFTPLLFLTLIYWIMRIINSLKKSEAVT